MQIHSFSNTLSIAFSSSPSFERQEISDVKNGDWIFWSSEKEEIKIKSEDGMVLSIPVADNRSQCTFERNIFPEIKSVSYMSDGNRLKATIWVSSILLENVLLKNTINDENFNDTVSFLPLWYNLKFTMAIDVLSILDEGIDYRVDLIGEEINSTHKTWKKELYELSNDGTYKILSSQSFDEFPYLQKEFVDFSVDLKQISNPQKYRILFYITDLYVKDGKLCRMVDSTNWALSPPPEFNIMVSPNTIFMRPGDSKEVAVTISGNTELQSNGSLSFNDIHKNSADIRFLTNEIVISSFSNGSSILHVEIPDSNVTTPVQTIMEFIDSILNTNFSKSKPNEPKHLAIPISANISFPTTIINRDGETFYNNKSISLLEHSKILLTILPPLTLTERVEEFADRLKPVSDLWQILLPIGTVVITVAFYFYRRVGKKSKKNDKASSKKIDEF